MIWGFMRFRFRFRDLAGSGFSFLSLGLRNYSLEVRDFVPCRHAGLGNFSLFVQRVGFGFIV